MEKSPVEVHVLACLEGQALGYKRAGRLVEHADAKIQRCLESWQLCPPGRYLWEAPPLQRLQRQPKGHGQFDTKQATLDVLVARMP